MHHQEAISPLALRKIGSKKDWVPMWFWIHIIFRLGLYEVWPIGYLVYRRHHADS